MNREETGTNETIIELLKENNFHSSMAAQKAGHAGLIAMAAYLVLKDSIDGEEDKISNVLLTVTMLLLIFDDIEIIIHAVKKLMER